MRAAMTHTAGMLRMCYTHTHVWPHSDACNHDSGAHANLKCGRRPRHTLLLQRMRQANAGGRVAAAAAFARWRLPSLAGRPLGLRVGV